MEEMEKALLRSCSGKSFIKLTTIVNRPINK